MKKHAMKSIAAPCDPAVGYSAGELAALIMNPSEPNDAAAHARLRRGLSEFVSMARLGELPTPVAIDDFIALGERARRAEEECARLRGELAKAVRVSAAVA